MRVTQVIATLAPLGLVAAGPLHNHQRHTHLHHLHHRSVNGTLDSNYTTTDTANSTIYADHIVYATSTVNVAANFADGTDSSSASSEAASSIISESSSISSSSSTTAQSETVFSTLSFTSDVSYASGSPSNSSSILNTSSAIPSDASVSIVLAVAATTPTAVGALSQKVDTTTSISIDTVYNTITVNGAVTTASASEKTVTVTDVVTNFVTATFSALTPFKAPAIKALALSSGSSCAAIKTSIVYLPASASPTLVNGGSSASKAASSSSKATSQTTIRYVSQSASKSSSSSIKKSSTSSKKTSTSAVVLPVSTKKSSSTVKPSSTSTKKTSASPVKASTSSIKKTSSASSVKKASTSSVKKATSSSVKPVSSSSKLITLSSLVQKGATTKTLVSTSTIIPFASSSSYKASSSAKLSSQSAASSAKASPSGCATVAAPASTQTGIVSGCTKWYTAKSGDYCYAIASANGISTDTFMSWNPAVNAPSCDSIWVGYAYCVAAGCSSSTPSSAAKSVTASTKASVPASAATASTKTSATTSAATSTVVSSSSYTMYTGDGSTSAGWPAQSAWMDFDSMFTANIPIMQQSCANNGWGANNSPTEISDIKAAIKKVSASSGVDARFILAIVMQESNGCVRVVTTSWSVQNPGLMQDHAGNGTCNSGGVIQDPCPSAEIEQMIIDGTTGTTSGDGLVQCLSQASASDVSKYYRAARIYNGGLAGWNKADLGKGCCTLCYASDVANRLTGWSSGVSGCHLS
ncbi:hypothetical protein E4T39_05678 [Aureobasidium subglaciale]|nr:hypothetical protein E4T39_05678 [Aureobasidium subglaciale]